MGTKRANVVRILLTLVCMCSLIAIVATPAGAIFGHTTATNQLEQATPAPGGLSVSITEPADGAKEPTGALCQQDFMVKAEVTNTGETAVNQIYAIVTVNPSSGWVNILGPDILGPFNLGPNETEIVQWAMEGIDEGDGNITVMASGISLVGNITGQDTHLLHQKSIIAEVLTPPPAILDTGREFDVTFRFSNYSDIALIGVTGCVHWTGAAQLVDSVYYRRVLGDWPQAWQILDPTPITGGNQSHRNSCEILSAICTCCSIDVRWHFNITEAPSTVTMYATMTKDALADTSETATVYMPAPTIDLSPTSGMAGTEVSITGSHWTEGNISLTFGGVPWHATFADSNGEINEPDVATPGSATPGNKTVIGTDRLGFTASTAFIVVNNTPVGNDTSVVAQDPQTGNDTPVTVTFDEVTQAGDTTADVRDTGPAPPEGFELGTDPPTYFDIDTTAGYTPPVEVCIDYSGMNVKNENKLKLMHWDGSKWVDVTTSLDTVNDIICGEVTSFSDFAMMAPQWVVESLLPATENNKAGRTMPIKFSLRVDASVDPSQPFVYNEDLTIKIFATSDPGNILQTSTFGNGAQNYRIANGGRLYHTNFQTLKTPMQYTVQVYSGSFMVGSFTFKTVK